MQNSEDLVSRDMTAIQAVIRGLVYSHNRANANTAEVHEANVAVHALEDLLVERGILNGEAIEARKQETAEPLRRQYLEQGMGVAMQAFESSKYAFKGEAKIDCENRIHLCKGSCCRLTFALSKEDVEEGVVRWDLGRPYTIAHRNDGYCVHRNTERCNCSLYAQRPITCRGYDCRNDKRIWEDFENKIINPRLGDPDWPGCVEVDDATKERATKSSNDPKIPGQQEQDAKVQGSDSTGKSVDPLPHSTRSLRFQRARLPVLKVQHAASVATNFTETERRLIQEDNPTSESQLHVLEDPPTQSRFHAWFNAFKRRPSPTAPFDLLHPKHLKEIGEALGHIDSTTNGKRNQDHIATTSRGVKIAANQLEGTTGPIQHISLSGTQAMLNEAVAATLAQFILQLLQSTGKPELIQGEQGIFHLLIYPQEAGVATG